MESTPLKVLFIFTAFWCSLTGLFLVVQVLRGWQVWDARRHFLPASAVVLASEVVDSTGSEGSTYAPRIRYRYRVAGRDHEGDRYDLGGGGASDDRGWSRRVVDAHPPGAEIAIWYDPRMPDNAVIACGWPRNYWFLWMFMQPFLVAGIGLIASIGVIIRWRRARRHCLAGSLVAGWTIPGWGTCAADARGLRIGGGLDTWTAVSTAGVSYGGLVFLTMFPVAFLGGGSEDVPWGRDGRVIAALLGANLAVAIGVGIAVYRRSSIALLVIDERERRVTLRSRHGSLEAPWSAIDAWRVQRTATTDDGTTTYSYAVTLTAAGRAPLVALTTGSAEVAVHVAGKLAAATASPCFAEPRGDGQVART
ncbi:MAG: DUF3592 domain-containing protein [Planctomycetes bacterium]|nr:DUF3592 domain-containing protein [Planctomycetota bacterium]